MIMLKKNLSRHIRDQHAGTERPRSVCPLCWKTYKTQDWLKDHVRRGHGYTKAETDELMAKIKAGTYYNVPPASPHKDEGQPMSPASSTASGGDTNGSVCGGSAGEADGETGQVNNSVKLNDDRSMKLAV